MAVSLTTTDTTILKVDQRKGFYSIEADIPAFGKFPSRFLIWNDEQGNPPKPGETGHGTFEPTKRQSRFVKDGTFPNEIIDGSEMPWQVNWRITAFDMNGTAASHADITETYPNGPGFATKDKPNIQTASTQGQQTSSNLVTGGNKPVFLDANKRFLVESQSINDREAIRMVLSQGQTDGVNVYADMAVVLEEAEKVSAWLNNRFLIRMSPDLENEPEQQINSPLVNAAIDMGAEVVSVEKETTVKNEAELKNYFKDRMEAEDEGWTRESVIQVIKDSGFETATDYIAAEGNTAQGLLELLQDKLDGKSVDSFNW